MKVTFINGRMFSRVLMDCRIFLLNQHGIYADGGKFYFNQHKTKLSVDYFHDDRIYCFEFRILGVDKYKLIRKYDISK